uniref:Potassium transporter n=1 Tax=Oryza barthii TaxID=65489 RepID=A0A0D3GRG3_9ORYZ
METRSGGSGSASGGGGGGRMRLRKTESAEMRWVVSGGAYEEDEIESSDGGGGTPAAASGSRGGCSDSDDNYEEAEMLRQRLVRTGPRADSLDVEAQDVAGMNRHQEITVGRSIVLAVQTLGVVFGDVGTSPLYAFDVMFNKYPITSKEDVLGALSLVIYTLILIPLLKYTLIALWGNDDGEGGTFALYSLICRNARVSLLPNQLRSDTRISSFQLQVPSVELERSLKIKERLETSSMLKKLLLMLVLFGTSMVIADGVVTPAMSVMSAVNGLKVGISSVNEGEVVMITVAVLIVLFTLQRFGSSKVALAVGPALFIWFCCLAGIGIYNMKTYGTQPKLGCPLEAVFYVLLVVLSVVLRVNVALHILVLTMSNVLQLTFVFLVLPCLLLGYLGQAAFLMENLTENQQVFFLSIPNQAFWPVVFIAILAAIIASRTMTTAIFSTIKQATALGCFPRLKIIHTSRSFMGQIYIPMMNWFLLVSCLAFVTMFGSINEIGNAYGIAELGVMMMTTVLVTIIMLLIWQINIIVVLCFLTLSLGLELIFFSSVLGSVADGSWVLLVFAAVLYLIMYIWNYGTKLKYETEVKQKLSMDLLMELGCNLGTVRVPGIGLLYNELARGVPGIFGQFLATMPAIHSMIIFVCIKYGYKDIRKEDYISFQQLLIESLEKFMRREAQERSLESDQYDGTDSEEEVASASSRALVGPNGSIDSLGVPPAEAAGTTEHPTIGSSMSFDGSLDEAIDGRGSLDDELSFIHKAKESGVVYLLGHGDIRARKESFFVKKLVINYFYAFLRRNCRRGIAALSIPPSRMMQVAMQYMV